MPYQTVPPFIIIGAMFAVTGGIMAGVQYLSYGEKRIVGKGQFDHLLDRRDRTLKGIKTTIQTTINTAEEEEKVARKDKST